MANCSGCEFSCAFYPSTTPPFIWAVAGFAPAAAWPDGTCTDGKAGCVGIPCRPIGQVAIISNVVQRPIRVVPYHGAEFTLEHFGEGGVIPNVDLTIPCGDDFLAATLYDAEDGSELGTVRLRCSMCGF